MNVDIRTLLPIDVFKENPDSVFSIVERYGQAVLLKDNVPIYVIAKVQQDSNSFVQTNPAIGIQMRENRTPPVYSYTLQDAMRIVLSEAENYQMHAAELADAVYERGLYVQKNGEKAKYNQMRARCGHYPEMFEALPGNIIRLRSHDKEER